MGVFAHHLRGVEQIPKADTAPPERRLTEWTGEECLRSRLHCRNLRLTFQIEVCRYLFDRIVLIHVDKRHRSTAAPEVQVRQRTTGVDVEDFDSFVVVDDDGAWMRDVFVAAVRLHAAILDSNEMLAFKVDDVLQRGERFERRDGLDPTADHRRFAKVAEVEFCVADVFPRVRLK